MQKKGILLVDKPCGMTSFAVIAKLRKIFHVKTIGHAGTLDPFATGVLVVLVGREYTKQQERFLCDSKEYFATVTLGIATDTHDCEGQVIFSSDRLPEEKEIISAVNTFQGVIDQLPPMFSAKKVGGRRLYEFARQGKSVERQKCQVKFDIEILRYEYPELELRVSASKGAYIRTLAHDLGEYLGVGAHLSKLRRTRSGSFHIADCIALSQVEPTTQLIEDLVL